MVHERYNPDHPLLRELVFVHVDGDDGESFDVLLTRVPGIGEEIDRDACSYKVMRVQHEPVDDDGRARLGWHAFVEAQFRPDDETPPPGHSWKTRKRRSKRRD